jgi:hypothetical protein
VTPVRHRALIFDARLFAGNAADDTLVTGGPFRFCRLMCLCVKRRNIMLNDKRRSLLNSALFRADNRTGQKTFSPFSLALILHSILPLFPNVVPARRIAPGVSFSLVRWMRHFAREHIPFGRSCNFQGSGAIARPF